LAYAYLQLFTARPAVNVSCDVLEKYYRKEVGNLVGQRAGK
jgi:hypothetical protein